MSINAPILIPNYQEQMENHEIIKLWVYRKSPQTQRAYTNDSKRLFDFLCESKPLAKITLSNLQDFADSLEHLAPRSQMRILASIRSLLTFANKIGVIPFNVGTTLVMPAVENTLAERILPETDVMRLISLEPNKRNRAMLTLFYASGIRCSELCNLKWRNTQHRNDGGGQISIYGKGSKTRVILLKATTFQMLLELRGSATDEEPVFKSRKGGILDNSRVRRIVKDAAKRIGITDKFSPHWLRHAHASHALDRGAQIHQVQQTLGHSSVATTGRYLHARPNDSSAFYLLI